MDRLTIVIIALTLGVAGVTSGLLFFDNPTYEILYELDGGELSEDAPTSYQPGDVIDLPEASKEDYYFRGWVLSEDAEEFFDGDTSGLEGTITLTAVYTQNLTGFWQKFNVSGSYNSRYTESYTLTGTQTFKFMYYDSEKDSYYMHCDYYHVRSYNNGAVNTTEDSYEYWPSDLVRNLTGTWTETIDTVDGQKLCTVEEYTNSDGSKDTYWTTDDSWHAYKWTSTEYIGSIFKKTMVTTFTFDSWGQDEVPNDCTVTVVAGNGITISGNESPYTLGSKATLTAELDSGTSFAGWYDSNLSRVSTSLTYSFTVTGNMTFYALNNSSIDVVFASDETVDLNIEGDLSDEATYVITNADTGTEDKTIGGEYMFDNGGPYTVIATDTDGSKKAYNVKVTGIADREFSWKYNNKTFSITVEIDYDDLLKARSLYSVSDRQYSSTTSHNTSFVTKAYTESFMKPYMDQIVEKMYAELQNKGISITDSNVANYILRFVQYIEYQLDEEYMGTEEYWKFPLETLYDQGGDCEDTAILFAAIGYVFKETYDMDYDIGFQVVPQHAIGIVKLSGYSSYSKNPEGWLYCETTAKKDNAKDVGVIPTMQVTSAYYGTYNVSEFFTKSKYYTDRYKTCEIFAIG